MRLRSTCVIKCQREAYGLLFFWGEGGLVIMIFRDTVTSTQKDNKLILYGYHEADELGKLGAKWSERGQLC